MILFQFTEVMFVDDNTKEKAAFSKTGPEITFNNNYNKDASTYGQWNGHGVASVDYQYQLMICDMPFYKGIHVSGYSSCYKKCNQWCDDKASRYFRTAAAQKQFIGVAFNVNGHTPLPKRLISAGMRLKNVF